MIAVSLASGRAVTCERVLCLPVVLLNVRFNVLYCLLLVLQLQINSSHLQNHDANLFSIWLCQVKTAEGRRRVSAAQPTSTTHTHYAVVGIFLDYFVFWTSNLASSYRLFRPLRLFRLLNGYNLLKPNWHPPRRWCERKTFFNHGVVRTSIV